jgi:hypothetical protein
MNKIFKKQFSKAFAITSAILMAADTLAPNKIKANNQTGVNPPTTDLSAPKKTIQTLALENIRKNKFGYLLGGVLTALGFFGGHTVGKRNAHMPENTLKSDKSDIENAVEKVFCFLTLEPGEKLSEKLNKSQIRDMYLGATFLNSILVSTDDDEPAPTDEGLDLLDLIFNKCKNMIKQSRKPGYSCNFLICDGNNSPRGQENRGPKFYNLDGFSELVRLTEESECAEGVLLSGDFRVCLASLLQTIYSIIRIKPNDGLRFLMVYDLVNDSQQISI